MVTQLAASYLFAYVFWLGIALGSLGLAMLHALTGGKWGEAIRAPLNAAMATLPIMAIVFVPVLLGAHALYPWTKATDKAAYLNLPFFTFRAAVYFAIWIGLAIMMRRRRTAFAGLGLVLYVVTMTFAGWDWLMSLEPAWWSSIYGMNIVAGQGLAALSLMIIIAVRDGTTDEKTSIDLGNLLLAFVMFWAYLAFSEFLIMWSANLSDEIAWYVPRLKTSWGWFGAALLIFAFFAPFLVLLFRSAKKSGRVLAAVAGVVIVMRFMHLLWTIAPAFHRDHLFVSWLDIVLPAAMGAAWLFAFNRRLLHEDA